ncbi:hypothetical protein GJ496_007671 [Pomphorhynchus laevis]|nr:hypothetical protein GJ496_007671 [Pomphorhynchus laevis]
MIRCRSRSPHKSTTRPSVVAYVRSQLNHPKHSCELGVVVPRGIASAIHAARTFMQDYACSNNALLMLDFRNALNSVKLNVIIDKVAQNVPAILPFVKICYSMQSHLFSFSEERDYIIQ